MLPMFCFLQFNQQYGLQASYASCVVSLAEGGKADRDIMKATLDVTMSRERAAMYYPDREGTLKLGAEAPSQTG